MRLRLLALVILVASSLSAQATTIYSTSFEQPGFHAGTLAGQGGYSGSSVGQVETGVAYSGSQAVEFNAAGNTGEYVDSINSTFSATPGDETVDIQIAGMFTNPNVPFDVIAYFSSSDYLGQLLYYNGDVTLGSSSVAVATNTWNIYDLDLDYATQTATAYVNGEEIGSLAFLTSAQDLGKLEFGINDSPDPASGAGYFDDLSVTTSPTPEPSTLVLLCTGLVAVAASARRKLFCR